MFLKFDFDFAKTSPVQLVSTKFYDQKKPKQRDEKREFKTKD